MKTLKTLIIVCFVFCKVSYGQPTYVGIPSSTMQYFVASQNNSNWCWAASLQMIFNYYGVNIKQEQIVYRSYGIDPYGNLPNWTGSLEVITANLNNSTIDNSGRQYTVRSAFYFGAPTSAFLINELSQQRPVLIGYKTGPNSGHAVVVTAVSYYPSTMGPQIQTIVVRDPWPSEQNVANMGRAEYRGDNLANLMMAHWYVSIY